ncbi:helix-turn-helix transcriptional regulator [Paraburkholderia sp. Ac-20340]|uniref:helix-turn-helix domain-containing protein n=1 Tax=Paraburkholderia sp. Ac-20340 TaxID=2703888 RepID=UPI00197DCBC7|nr:helix-turn-helix domain-containing protein [Paraburkholderia sp. Ac-20340]MBN3851975.1 helix-turn-helix transcriptional regulator [Paraburkholderia sp. Ac-20340]
MSHHLTNQAWDIELRGMQKLVLLCLAHLSVMSTRECCPTIARIAVMCGISDSSVRDQIRALAALGLVEELRDGRIVHYRVNIGAPRDANVEA